MKLFAVKIGNNIGSFAPIELKEQTLKEMRALKKLNINSLPDKEKAKELEEIQKDLETATFIITETTEITEEKVF